MIKLSCDLCDEIVEFTTPVILALPHWAVIRGKNEFDERNYCPKCADIEYGEISKTDVE